MSDDKRNELGELPKHLLAALLEPVATVRVNMPIPRPELTLDLWFDACPLDADVRQRLGLLGRMLAQGPCIIERFYDSFTLRNYRESQLKQLEYDDRRQAAAAANQRVARDIFLWITLPTRPPAELVKGLGMRAREGWPEGFMDGSPIMQFAMVFMDEVPDTPDTRILRRLTSRATSTEAFADLDSAGLPRSTWTHLLHLPGTSVDQGE